MATPVSRTPRTTRSVKPARPPAKTTAVATVKPNSLSSCNTPSPPAASPVTGGFLLSSVSYKELVSVMDDNPSLRGYLQGYMAEIKLSSYLSSLPGVTGVRKIQDHSDEKGDFAFTYEGREWRTELKSIATSGIRENYLEGGMSGSVRLKAPGTRVIFNDGQKDIRATNLKRGQFDILAISLVSMTGKWDFKFLANRHIQSSPYLSDEYLSTTIQINTENTPFLRDCILEVVRDLS